MAIPINITITPPPGMSDAEALQLYTNYHGYVVGQPETRAQFAKRVIVDSVKSSIKAQRTNVAQAAISIPDDVVVE